MEQVERYADLVAAPIEGSKTEEDVFGKEFVQIFRDEFGISPGRLAELGMVLLENAIKQSTFVVIREAGAGIDGGRSIPE